MAGSLQPETSPDQSSLTFLEHPEVAPLLGATAVALFLGDGHELLVELLVSILIFDVRQLLAELLLETKQNTINCCFSIT